MGRNGRIDGPLSGLDVGVSARDAVVAVSDALDLAEIDGAKRDARLLVMAALQWSGIDFVREPERALTEAEVKALDVFARRRISHEPVSRILGERGFFGRIFRITPATLDPRPCTETVVEAALELAREEGWRERPIRILDIGTGSGALLVTLLAELPLASGVGTDISPDALDVARDNAERLGVAARASFERRDMLQDVGGTFDLVVSNPPYIPRGDIAGLDPDVREFDPMGALDGGIDGLDFYRQIADEVGRVMPDGWVLMEVGAGQSPDVEALFSGGSEPQRRRWKDLGQHVRCVAARIQSGSRR
jgi:release factor glutamine methyltransferase